MAGPGNSLGHSCWEASFKTSRTSLKDLTKWGREHGTRTIVKSVGLWRLPDGAEPLTQVLEVLVVLVVLVNAGLVPSVETLVSSNGISVFPVIPCVFQSSLVYILSSTERLCLQQTNPNLNTNKQKKP